MRWRPELKNGWHTNIFRLSLFLLLLTSATCDEDNNADSNAKGPGTTTKASNPNAGDPKPQNPKPISNPNVATPNKTDDTGNNNRGSHPYNNYDQDNRQPLAANLAIIKCTSHCEKISGPLFECAEIRDYEWKGNAYHFEDNNIRCKRKPHFGDVWKSCNLWCSRQHGDPLGVGASSCLAVEDRIPPLKIEGKEESPLDRYFSFRCRAVAVPPTDFRWLYVAFLVAIIFLCLYSNVMVTMVRNFVQNIPIPQEDDDETIERKESKTQDKKKKSISSRVEAGKIATVPLPGIVDAGNHASLASGRGKSQEKSVGDTDTGSIAWVAPAKTFANPQAHLTDTSSSPNSDRPNLAKPGVSAPERIDTGSINSVRAPSIVAFGSTQSWSTPNSVITTGTSPEGPASTGTNVPTQSTQQGTTTSSETRSSGATF